MGLVPERLPDEPLSFCLIPEVPRLLIPHPIYNKPATSIEKYSIYEPHYRLTKYQNLTIFKKKEITINRNLYNTLQRREISKGG